MSINATIIRATFKDVLAQGPAFISRFYEILWDRYPVSQTFFQDVDMEKQKAALLNALKTCVDNLDSLEKVVPFLQQMGKRHVDYGVQPEHYDLVGECLLATFEEYFYTEWTPEYASQWTQVYQIVANTMIDGAKMKQTSEPTSTTTPTEPTPTLTAVNSQNFNHDELMDLIKKKATEHAKREVQVLWEKAFSEAVQSELQELIKKQSSAA